MKLIISLALALSVPLSALAAVPLYGELVQHFTSELVLTTSFTIGQCGGLSYSGETECISGK
jgi:hypothetical protein